MLLMLISCKNSFILASHGAFILYFISLLTLLYKLCTLNVVMCGHAYMHSHDAI